MDRSVLAKAVNQYALAAAQQYNSLVAVDIQTPEVCMYFVKEDGLQIKHVHEQTPEICMAAVKQNGMALQYVDDQLKTPEICMAAVQQNGEAYFHIPIEMRSDTHSENRNKLRLAAIKQSAAALKYMAQTIELCMYAFECHGEKAIRYFKHDIVMELTKV